MDRRERLYWFRTAQDVRTNGVSEEEEVAEEV